MLRALLYLICFMMSFERSFCEDSLKKNDELSLVGLSNREFRLKSAQEDLLGADLPAQAQFLSDGRILWIAGQRYIWKWSLHEGSLQRLEISDKIGDIVDYIAFFHGFLYLASGRKLWQISFSPHKIFSFEIDPAILGHGKTNRIMTTDQKIIWILPYSVLLIDPLQRSLAVLFHSHNWEAGDQLDFSPSSGKVLIWRGHHLMYSSSIGSSDPYLKEVLNLEKISPLMLTASEKYFFAYTPFSVLVFDEKASLIRSLPVEGGSRLLQAFVSKAQHSYLFDDGYVEIYKIDKKRSFYTKIPIVTEMSLASFSGDGSVISMISQGRPRAFQLEGVW
ncbi:MAG: hypothetical protein H6618_07250 [Deltaproteobacteria bacterium]|nr:hypothetical protein [Deltaproteobacteria bacterium]